MCYRYFSSDLTGAWVRDYTPGFMINVTYDPNFLHNNVCVPSNVINQKELCEENTLTAFHYERL